MENTSTNFIDTIIGYITSSRAYNGIKKFINSLMTSPNVTETKATVDSYVNTAESIPNPAINTTNISIGERASKSVKKFLKKFGKKFKNEAKATSVIKKVVNTIVKILSIAITLAFIALVIYVMAKILRYVIVALAFTFAVAIIGEVLMGAVENTVNAKA